MIEKKHRIEDALEAVKSAQEAGLVPGGGVALVRALESIDGLDAANEDQRLGVEILRKALCAPIRQMALNGGLSADIILDLVMNEENSIGFDFKNNEMVDMIDAGIVDPCKVTVTALQSAVSAAGTLITTSHAIIEG